MEDLLKTLAGGVGAILGAAAGTALGFIAGPSGAVFGFAIGLTSGASAGAALCGKARRKEAKTHDHLNSGRRPGRRGRSAGCSDWTGFHLRSHGRRLRKTRRRGKASSVICFFCLSCRLGRQAPVQPGFPGHDQFLHGKGDLNRSKEGNIPHLWMTPSFLLSLDEPCNSALFPRKTSWKADPKVVPHSAS